MWKVQPNAYLDRHRVQCGRRRADSKEQQEHVTRKMFANFCCCCAFIRNLNTFSHILAEGRRSSSKRTLCKSAWNCRLSAWERRRSVLTLREIVLHKHRIPAQVDGCWCRPLLVALRACCVTVGLLALPLLDNVCGMSRMQEFHTQIPRTRAKKCTTSQHSKCKTHSWRA